jgi:hypothetical protein
VCAVSAELPELVIDRAHATPERGGAPGAVRQTWRDHEGRVVATGGYDGQLWWMRWSGLATFWFAELGPTTAVPVIGASDSDIHDIYVRGVLPVVLLARGLEALHASAVVLPDGSVVGLCATSGTGKSTLAFAMTAFGGNHYADDVLVYRIVDRQPLALSLPFPVRVDSVAQDAARRSPASAQVPASVVAPVRRIYELVRDVDLDPHEPRFDRVPAARRFETLLAHAHPFEMGPAIRHRQFIERLLAAAETLDIWQCCFAPSLAALPQLAARVHAHASTS